MRECDGSCAQEACGTSTKTVTVEERDRLIRLGAPPDAFSQVTPYIWTVTMKNDPCPFLRDGRCAAYAERPLQCRSWVCSKCGGSDDQRTAYGREVFQRLRSNENGWARLIPVTE